MHKLGDFIDGLVASLDRKTVTVATVAFVVGALVF